MLFVRDVPHLENLVEEVMAMTSLASMPLMTAIELLDWIWAGVLVIGFVVFFVIQCLDR